MHTDCFMLSFLSVRYIFICMGNKTAQTLARPCIVSMTKEMLPYILPTCFVRPAKAFIRPALCTELSKTCLCEIALAACDRNGPAL